MYDDLSSYFHLIFADWNRSIAYQAEVIGSLLEREVPSLRLRILDCACGIGTQTLGLAGRGHLMTGSDLSASAIARARDEAEQRNLSIHYEVADMRNLSSVAGLEYDVVMAADNALPHLLTDADVSAALQSISTKLRSGGVFLATIRDYDTIIETRPPVSPPAFFQDGAFRRIYHQVWDWRDERQYTVHLYLTRETPTGWDSHHFVSIYRAVRREELSTVAAQAGFTDIRWLLPSESGYYQPVLLARKP
jgi:2-polyprenyl-3-methyl-5-hydroxy-6-metoxy-1,4-benzoquinol methylase